MAMLVYSSTRRESPVAGNPVFGDFLALLTAVSRSLSHSHRADPTATKGSR